MAQEFTINSSAIESKINQLLPSQGGFGSGVDFSASTMVIPIVDLTESAEGSGLRQDLQTALSFDTGTSFSIRNATNTVIINTPGYFRVFGTSVSGQLQSNFNLFDGTTTKQIALYGLAANTVYPAVTPFDFVVFLSAGDSLRGTSASTTNFLSGITRQIADISGNLVNP